MNDENVVLSHSLISSTIKLVKFCRKDFPVPKYHDPSKTTYSLKKNDDSIFEVDSFISYECLAGYFFQKNKRIQSTKCNMNGSWSSIEDCEKHKCLSKLPKRPLNGRRSVKLILNLNGIDNKSIVEFSCNNHFDLIGPSHIYCINYKWQNRQPVCVLKKNICVNRPPILFENSKLVSLKKVRIEFEHNYTNSTNFFHYTEAMYACLPGFRYADLNNIEFKYFHRILVPYKKIICIEPDKWESIPECVKD